MTETAVTPIETRRRIFFGWIPAVLFRPRAAFARIASHPRDIWLTPLLVLSLAALAAVAAGGPIRLEAAVNSAAPPPEFEWWTPEQQAQFQQAQQATQGPVFIYVFPALLALGKVWMGWLIVGGLLHLVLTLLGGRGNTGSAMNIVAWAGLPFAVRALVQTGYMLATQRTIAGQGLAGFAPPGEGYGFAFLANLLGQIDLYLIWHIILVGIGTQAANGLPRLKAWGGALVVVLAVTAALALLLSVTTLFGDTTMVRPFFF